MKAMFVCEDGTMFPLDEILSITEAKKYVDKRGMKFSPSRTFMSECELQDAMREDSRKKRSMNFSEMLDVIGCLPIVAIWFLWWPFGKIFGKPWRLWMNKKEDDLWVKRLGKERLNNYDMTGYFLTSENAYWCMRQWEVRLDNHKKTIHISNTDYTKLCAELGRPVGG